MKKVLKKVMALTLAAVLTIGTAVTSTAATPSPTTGKEPHHYEIVRFRA